MTSTPIRQGIATGATVSGKDWSTQGRDLDSFLSNLVPFSKVTYQGYAKYPIALAVSSAPFAILAVRIVPSANVQAIAPQGGFCSFFYDAGPGVANVTAINAFIASSGAPISEFALFDFNFLVVF